MHRRSKSVLDDGTKIIFVIVLIISLLLIWAVMAALTAWPWDRSALLITDYIAYEHSGRAFAAYDCDIAAIVKPT